MTNGNKRKEFRDTLKREIEKYSDIDCVVTNSGDLRFEKVVIDEKTQVDIDISFVGKTNKVAYSSDICLKDRLNTIEKIDNEKAKYVRANIILAKRLLKQSGVYKSRDTKKAQGGLGDIGVENWILENGCSLYDASKTFLKAAEGKSFEEFKDIYSVWDFVENHLKAYRGKNEDDKKIKR